MGGEWLRKVREDQGFSQRDLTKRVGVDYYTLISQLETGRGRVPPERYALWAEALGIDARVFVKTLMQYYDPVTYAVLFPDERPAAPVNPCHLPDDGSVVRLGEKQGKGVA